MTETTSTATLTGMIRKIARAIVGGAVSDFQITKVAAAAGCDCPVTASLATLDLMERFRLGKYMLEQGRRSGLTVEEMGRL